MRHKIHILVGAAAVSGLLASCDPSQIDDLAEKYAAQRAEGIAADSMGDGVVEIALPRPGWGWHKSSPAAVKGDAPSTGCDGANDRLRYAIYRTNSLCLGERVATGTVTGLEFDGGGRARVSLPRFKGNRATAYLWVDDSSCGLYSLEAPALTANGPDDVSIKIDPAKVAQFGERTQGFLGTVYANEDGVWKPETTLKNPFACVVIHSGTAKTVEMRLRTSFSFFDGGQTGSVEEARDASRFRFPAGEDGVAFRNLVFAPLSQVDESAIFLASFDDSWYWGRMHRGEISWVSR